MSTEQGNKIKLLLAAIISHVFWGFSFLCTKAALGVADMYVLLSHRFLLAFAIMNNDVKALTVAPGIGK